VDRGHNDVIKIKFSARDCGPCPSRAQCTRGERESSEEFAQEYARRAGVEGTISQGVRSCGLRRARYVGEAKVHLQHVATAAAINVLRISDWLMDKPREQTRTSAFAKLMAPTPAA
jgi:transposase